MLLADGLKKNNIILKAKSKDRWALIEEMLDIAVKNKDIHPDKRKSVKKSLVEREKSMSTGIGNSVAIPHCTTEDVSEVVIMLAMNSDGIDFDAVDNAPVRIAILLIVPKSRFAQHIKTLASIAKIMSDGSFREELLKLKTASAVLKALKEQQQ